LECILIGWIFKASRLREHINHAGQIVLSKFWDICVRFITPAVLIALIFNSLSQEISSPYGGYSWVALLMIGRDWLMVALIAALFVAMRGWKKDLSQED
jgi:NSS family neurotransmitter:Na+ symporter